MINRISSWTSSIVASVIVVTILEMILPDSKNKKYIKMVMGIYILFAIISPIIKAVSNQEINFNNFIKIENKNTNISSIETNASIASIYETNMKIDIKNKIEEKGFKVKNVTISIEKNNNNLGKIYSINVELEKEERKENSSINSVIIEIGYNKSNDKEVPGKEIEEIREFLSSTYGVEKDKINIT